MISCIFRLLILQFPYFILIKNFFQISWQVKNNTNIFQIVDNIAKDYQSEQSIMNNHFHSQLFKNLVYPQFATYHMTLMPILWSVVINILVILGVFSSSKICIYIHAIGCFILSAVTIFVTLMLSAGLQHTIHDSWILSCHYVVGSIVLLLCFTQIFFGIFVRITNIMQFKSQTVEGMRLTHRITGILLLVLCKFQVYYNSMEQFIMPYFAFEFLFIFIYIWLKLKKSLTEDPKIFLGNRTKNLRQIRSLKELNSNVPLAIINNKVYDISPLQNWHPPGFQIIQSVKSRQFDKYLLGIYSPQLLPNVQGHAHSTQILNLLDQPIAELAIRSNYLNHFSTIEVNIEQLFLTSSIPRIYEMHLRSTSQPFQFKNYNDLSELGRYHSLTLNRNVTRLYTNVNFLQHSNIELLKRCLRPTPILQQYFQLRSVSANTIPLLFKHYDNGLFTNAIINESITKLQISQQLGCGFSLGQARSGQILIIAGGTGIFPFVDLIDLLFKLKLLRINHFLGNQIIKNNPILAKKQLQRFSFKFLLGFRSLQQIHPIILQLLIQISDFIQIQIRFDIQSNISQASIGRIKIVKYFFDNELRRTIKHENLSKIMICGPPIMRQSLLKILLQEQVIDSLYMIL